MLGPQQDTCWKAVGTPCASMVGVPALSSVTLGEPRVPGTVSGTDVQRRL